MIPCLSFSAKVLARLGLESFV